MRHAGLLPPLDAGPAKDPLRSDPQTQTHAFKGAPVQVDALACRIAADPPHIYISNAFLTVEQSSSYYAAVRGVEQRMLPVG